MMVLESIHYITFSSRRKNQIIGLSFYHIRYSTWKGKFLFLKILLLKKNIENLGIGSQLFEATIKICYEKNMKGMFWQVLDWNTPAINFYKKYNAEISSSWLNGKLNHLDINKIYTKLNQ